jgi:prepilin-type N-terminal cleavage/methylation domain-containing protein
MIVFRPDERMRTPASRRPYRSMWTRTLSRPYQGFTLIEIMVVCAIIGVIMTISVPTIYRQLHPESMQKAVNDVLEACQEARTQAVLTGTIHELVINREDRQIQVVPAPKQPKTSSMDRLESLNLAGEEWRIPDRDATPAQSAGASVFTAKLSDKILIDLIGVNRMDFTDAPTTRVQFHPNGISDDFHMVLRGGENDTRMIFLEAVTGLADVEMDPQKFKSR